MIMPNFGRPPEGVLRPEKVAEAQKKISQGLDQDPVAIGEVVKELMKKLFPQQNKKDKK